MSAMCRRTRGQRGAADPLAVGFCEPRPGYRRGCSLLPYSVGLIPAMESLLRRVRHLAVLAPGIEAVVNDPPRQMRHRDIGAGDGGAIGGGTRQQFAGRL